MQSNEDDSELRQEVENYPVPYNLGAALIPRWKYGAETARE